MTPITDEQASRMAEAYRAEMARIAKVYANVEGVWLAAARSSAMKSAAQVLDGGWMGIESALDDESVREGEHVLLFGALKRDRVTTGFYFEGAWWGYAHPRQGVVKGLEPTHWRPLPPPPTPVEKWAMQNDKQSRVMWCLTAGFSTADAALFHHGAGAMIWVAATVYCFVCAVRAANGLPDL